MQDLTLVGVHHDGEHLVLSATDGQKYLLLVNDPLRAAVRLDRARLGQLQIEAEGKLRPRDIQARIRAGQSAEEIADLAGVPVEHVRRFEGPVLAEREFVVRQAQAVRIRNTGRGGQDASTLGELVTERLAAREVDEAAITWDAWRGDDGVWVVGLTFTAGSRMRQARWSYDAALRHVVPRDDEARWLTEDEAEEPGVRQRRLTPVGGSGGRHESLHGGFGDPALRDRVYDVEADGGVRPVEELRPTVNRATVDLLDSLRERRGRRYRTSPAGDPEIAGGTLPDDPTDEGFHGGPLSAPSFHPGLLPTPLNGDALRDEAFGEPPAAHAPASRPDLALDAEMLVLPDDDDADTTILLPEELHVPGGGYAIHGQEASPGVPVESYGPPAGHGVPGGPGMAGQDGFADHHPGAPTPSASEPPVPQPGQGRRARRASVPKWDDIVFGSRRE